MFFFSKKTTIPLLNEEPILSEESAIIEEQISIEYPEVVEEIYSQPVATDVLTNDGYSIIENGFYLFDGNLVMLPEKNDGEPDQIDIVYHTRESKPIFMVKDDQFDAVELHLLVYTYGIGADGNYSSLGYSVERVFEGSPAEAAGLMVGDVFTKINGVKPIKMLDMLEINVLLRGYSGGWFEIE